jgi:gamma-glutamylputrescine oxidase
VNDGRINPALHRHISGKIDLSPFYTATAHPYRPYPPLAGALDVDVAVIGGGYTGLNCAIELADRGYRVCVLEARHIGWGCSGRNGGQVIRGIAAFERLRRHMGEDNARAAWRMGVEALDLVWQRIDRFGIDCDAVRGYFDAACSARQMRELVRSTELQRRLGYPHALEVVPADGLTSVVGSDAYVGGVADAGSGHLHPLNLCIGEAAGAAALGVRIHENTPVLRLLTGSRSRLSTPGGEVRAEFVVVAGDAYLHGVTRELRQRLLPAGSYLVATEPLAESVAREILPGNRAVCDQNVLLDYFRLSADRRLIFGGRCNHTGRRPRSIAGALRPRLLRVFPQLRRAAIEYEWGGTVGISLKRIPQFGRLPGNLYYAQGYSGHGIGPSHLAGRLIAEAVSGSAERFDVFARLRHRRLPGGRWIASPLLALAMTWFRLRELL